MGSVVEMDVIGLNMDEGTLKTPKCRLYWSFLFGVV
jgi:hypothetical protein